MGVVRDRVHRELSEEEILRIANTYHAGGAKREPVSMRIFQASVNQQNLKRSGSMDMS